MSVMDDGEPAAVRGLDKNSGGGDNIAKSVEMGNTKLRV